MSPILLNKLSSDKDQSEEEDQVEQRLKALARSITDFYLPWITGEETQLGDNQGKIEQLYGKDLLERDWRALRNRVLLDRDDNAPADPANVDPEGLRHLETIVEVTARRIEDLESERDDLPERIERRNETSGEGALEENLPASEVAEPIKERLQEIKEKLSLVRYRHSLAKTMITQIALFDTILSWDDFAPGLSLPEDHGTATIPTYKKRTILIGQVLKKYRRKHGQLPNFSKKSQLKEAFANSEYELFRCSPKRVADALKDAIHWVDTTGGRTAGRGVVRDIMNSAISYAEESDWKPSEDDIEGVLNQIESFTREIK